MTTGRDEDSPKPKAGTSSSALPHVRYHPSIQVPAKPSVQRGKSQQSTKTRHQTTTKELSPNKPQSYRRSAQNGTRKESKTECLDRPGVLFETEILAKNSIEKNIVLPQVRYHPSIRIPTTPKVTEVFQMTESEDCLKDQTSLAPKVTQRNSKTANLSLSGGTDFAQSRHSGKKNISMPQVRYHPSIKSQDCEQLRGSGVESTDTCYIQGDSEATTQKNARQMTKKSRNLRLQGSREMKPKEEDAAGEKTEKSTNPKNSEMVSAAGREELDLLAPPAGPRLDRDIVEQLEVRTQGQRSNPDWFSLRRNRITASVAHSVANSGFANEKTTTVPASYVRAIIGESGCVQTRAMAWGVEHEAEAVRKYQEQQSAALGHALSVQDCGLFIDAERPWLAASPDGIVTDGRTGQWLRCLEVKCPFKHRASSVEAAARDDHRFCLEIIDQDGMPQLALKRTHPYFTQVQCQLAVTGLKMADFVVFTQRDLAVVSVPFDPDFWDQTLGKLERFYRDAIVPVLRRKSQAWSPEI